MKLSLKSNLPFATVTLAFKGKSVEISNILIDTGSAITILASDADNLRIQI